MKKVTLAIENSAENRKIELEGELSVGRTNLAQEILSDSGLSRLNTTFFRDDEEIYVVDENSLNGTYVNGERIADKPTLLSDGDEIKIGSETRIFVEINEDFYTEAQTNEFKDGANVNDFQIGNFQTGENAGQQLSFADQNPKSKIQNPKSDKPPFILIAAALSAFGIIFLGLIGYLIASRYEGDSVNENSKPTPQINKSALIPVRVVDTLGIEDVEDLEEFIASWEVEEEELQASDIDAIETVSASTSNKPSDLKVSIEFWKTQREKSLNHIGVNEPLQPPVELMGRGVPKQRAKLAELINRGYKQPLDFADLAELQLKGVLIELPMATETYVLDVGGSASEEEFSSFDWDESGNQKYDLITPVHPKYKFLKQLADNFNGQKYDLNNPRDRKQMRIRLLRMYNPKSRVIFEEICAAYYQRFKVPLRITSLTRSMDYQIGLNKTNSNSFRVSGKGSLPPHTSGCAFDMSRKNLSSGEQNFIMAKLAEMERAQKIDSLLEGNANACFHTFIYP